MTQAAPAAQAPNHPFQYRLYRILWIGTLAANISIWMQNVGAAWLMASLTTSILMVALVQTATSLPTFFFGLPSGVIGDMVDRRRLLMAIHVGMFVTSCVTLLLLVLGVIGPWALLALTFALGTCNTINITVRQASIHDLLPPKVMVAAVGLNSVAYNGARAVGPALAGVLLAWLGTEAVFIANVLVFGMVLVLQVRAYDPPARQTASTENLWGAMRSGLRYVANAPALHPYLMRSAIFISAASSLWALLPVVARNHPDFGASGYGWLLTSLGSGAVVSGFLLERLRKRFTLDQLVITSCFVFAGATVAAALLDSILLMCAILLFGGAAWVLHNVILNSAFQTSLPGWVRARAISVQLLVFQGSLALGGALWGTVATYTGVPNALLIAAILMLVGLMVTRHFAIRMGHAPDYQPSQHWAEPVVHGVPSPDDGPVAVQMQYQIDPASRNEFVNAIHQLGVTRRRDGARSWSLYRDLANPDRYVERFIIESWAEHIRQQARATVSDQTAEDRVRAFHVGPAPITVTHFIGESNPPRNGLSADQVQLI